MTELIEELSLELDSQQPSLRQAEQYDSGTQPLAYLPPEALTLLGDRFSKADANYCRLVTRAIADRLLVTGFTRGGESLGGVWDVWAQAQMVTEHRKALLESLISGRSYVTVWGQGESPFITVDSPLQMVHRIDPVSRETILAFKRIVKNGRGYGVLWEPDRVTRYLGAEAPSGYVPATGWKPVETWDNPLGVVPVTPLINSHRLLDEIGTPQSRNIWGLQDLLNKLLSDMAVASEAVAGPRRWATGLQLQIDEDGNELNPFDSSPGSVWVSERVDTKFGQFDAADLSAYEDAIAIVIRQIGALSGLPDHLLGVESADPSSAEQIRAATESLSQTVAEKQRLFNAPFSRIAGLIEAVSTGGPVGMGISPTWLDSQDQTFSQLADGLTKLFSDGILPLEMVWSRLGFSPEEIREMKAMNVASRIQRGG